MNILQILPELNVGGVETGTVDLSKRLARLGHKSVVVSGGGHMVKELEANGVIHYRLDVHKKSFFNILKNIPRLEEIIKKENIDIVHARSRVPAWIAYYACRRTFRPLVTTCHGYYAKHLFSYPMGWGKLVICPSRVIARHMADDFGVPLERIRLVPRSVDIEKFQYSHPDEKRKEKEFNVGIIGRITPLKGHLDFFKAMARLARQVPNLKIWVVGDAPAAKEAYKEQVQVLVRRLGLWPNTQFLGTQRDIPGILKSLDAVVLASTVHDAFPRSIVESQASGVPVVATAVGGVIDIIEDGVNGLLVPPADPRSMAEAVFKIYSEPALARKFAEAAVKKVRDNYTAQHLLQNTLSVYREALQNFNILVIKFSSLGDVILSTAALGAVRERFPAPYKISVVVGLEAKEALLRSPHIDELIVADLKGKDRGLRGLLRLGKSLRKKNFDIVIDLQNNRKSHLLSYLTRGLKRYGYDNKKFGFLLNQGIKDDAGPLAPVAHQFRILEKLGIESKGQKLELWPSEEDKRYVEELLSAEWLSENTRLIGLNLSASLRWKTKRWRPEYMVRLCEEIGRHDMRVVVTGTDKDQNTALRLISLAKGVKIINTCGKTSVNQLATLIKRCSVFITGDSAPLHIASAMEVPVVAIFGPTDPARHLPPLKKYVLLRKELECSPCYKPECKKIACMDLITPEEVMEAALKLLS